MSEIRVRKQITDRVRWVLQLTIQEAKRLNDEYIGPEILIGLLKYPHAPTMPSGIGPEHILLGLLKEGNGVAVQVLKNLDLNVRKLRLEVEKLLQSEIGMATMGKLPQTLRVKKVIEYSIEEARNFGHNYLGTEHILLGLLHENEGVNVLMNMGLKLEEVREEVLNLLGHCVKGTEDLLNGDAVLDRVLNILGCKGVPEST